MKSGTRTVFRTDWFEVEEEWFDGLAALGGRPHYRIKSPDGVIVLALTDEQEVVFVRQFRPALRRETIELPSGAIEPDETPLTAARRELYEETGYVCDSLVEVGRGRLMMNRHVSREVAFVGTGARRAAGFQAREAIEVVPVPARDLRAMVRSGALEQLTALSVLVLAEWNHGVRIVPS